MAGNYMHTAKRLQTACRKSFGVKILIHSKQWYSEDKDMAMTLYTIAQAVYDTEKRKTITIELFKTYSQVQIVLFLRDFWYKLNGWEVPTDNEKWEEIKEQYVKKGSLSNIDPVKEGSEPDNRKHAIDSD